jgi:hypothetical protein
MSNNTKQGLQSLDAWSAADCSRCSVRDRSNSIIGGVVAGAVEITKLSCPCVQNIIGGILASTDSELRASLLTTGLTSKTF